MFKFSIALSYFTLAALAYFGSLNPYPLGLLSSFCIATSLTTLSFTLAKILGAQSTVFKVIHSFIAIFCAFIVVSSWYYFDYFRTLYTYDILAMGADLFSGSNALDVNAHLSSATILAAALTICLLFTLLTAKRQTIGAIWIISLAVCSFISIIVVENAIAHYRDRGINWLLPANLHPVHAFFYSSSDKSSIVNDEILANQYFSAANSKPNVAKISLKGNNNYNVLVILLESFRADLTGAYGGTSLTPNFDAIVEEGFLARQHLSNTTHTVSAEINIWCGIYDLIGERKLAYVTDTPLVLDCLPKILSDRGYQTLYFHGNTSEFYNRRQLLPQIGFKDNYFYKDEIEPLIAGGKIGWGVDDVTMFDTVLTKLKHLDKKSPFFAHFTTLSNHYPFRWNFSDDEFNPPFSNEIKSNSVYQNYQNMVAYTDYALGKFWRKFEQSNLSKNTIVVVTSDHGIWEFGDQHLALAEKNERFFRAPLFIYHPDQHSKKRWNDVSSHIDIPVTLSQILGIDFDKSMLGISLFSPPKGNNWAISTKGVDIIFRRKNLVCFHEIDECSIRQQDCKTAAGELKLLDSPEDTKVCLSLNGDPLIDSTTPTKTTVSHEYELARKYKSYQNKVRLREFLNE